MLDVSRLESKTRTDVQTFLHDRLPWRMPDLRVCENCGLATCCESCRRGFKLGTAIVSRVDHVHVRVWSYP